MTDGRYSLVHVDGPIYRLDTCDLEGNVVSSWLHSISESHLDKRISDMPESEGGVSDLAKYKFNQYVTVCGEKHWVTANTLQEFTDKVMRLSQGTGKGKHVFRDYALNWYTTYSKPNIATATATTYERQLRLHIFPVLGEKYVEDITVDDCQLLFNKIDGKKATKNKVREILSQIFDFASDDKLLNVNPLKSKRLKITGEESKRTELYDVKQMKYLAQHIEAIASPADRLFLAMLCFHPLRLEEFLGLKYGDINRQKCELSICRAVTHPTRNQPEIKETKTTASTRTTALSELALPYLTQGKANEFVFGGKSPLSYTQLRKMCQRIKRDINFSEDITPRRFRCTLLTDIYDQTRDIKLTQNAGGHATADITFKNYVQGREISHTATKALENLYT